MIQIPDRARLSYRLLGQDDGQLLWELDQDPQVMQYINGGQMTSMQDLQQKMLPRLAAYTDADKGWGMWGCFQQDKANDAEAFVGWILVRPMNFFNGEAEPRNLELGWRFKRSTWGQGIASEAAQQVSQALKAQAADAIDSFCAIADEANLASIGIMRKLGMDYVKTYLHQDPLFTTQVVYYQVNL